VSRRRQIAAWGRDAPGLALLAGSLVLLLGLLPAGATPLSIDRAAARQVVVRPHSGQRVGAHPLKVVVRSRDRVRDLRAKLNGKGISRDFGRTRHGKRRARISRSHGLNRGRNVLRVKVRRRNGKRRRQTVRFRIAHNRPLAGAGRDRRIVEGQAFRLHGSALPSRHNRHDAQYRWKLAHAPKGSRFAKPGAGGRGSKGTFLAAGSRGPTGARGGGSHTRRPRFLPDVNGTYKLKLRASQGSRSTVDTVALDAVPKTPLVPLETMPGERDSGKPAAVKVGEDTYAPDPVARAWLQVIVLDRKTLDPVPNISNRTYPCDSPGTCGATVAKDLSALNDKQLVIAVSHAGFTNPFSLSQALAPIGFPNLDANTLGGAPGGTVSAIGVPGLPPGEADVNFVPDGEPGDGDMDGYLTPNEYKQYTWLPKERPLFDSRNSSTVQG
jgi:hypothetical protein